MSDGAIIGPDGAEVELASVLDEHDCTAVLITLVTGEVLNTKASSVRLGLVSATRRLRDWHGPLESTGE